MDNDYGILMEITAFIVLAVMTGVRVLNFFKREKDMKVVVNTKKDNLLTLAELPAGKLAIIVANNPATTGVHGQIIMSTSLGTVCLSEPARYWAPNTHPDWKCRLLNSDEVVTLHND